MVKLNVGIIWKIVAIRQCHGGSCFSPLSFYTLFFYLKNLNTATAQTCSKWSNFPYVIQFWVPKYQFDKKLYFSDFHYYSIFYDYKKRALCTAFCLKFNDLQKLLFS